MMNSIVQWYLRKHLQGGSPWGMSNGWFPNQSVNQSHPSLSQNLNQPQQGTQSTWGAMGIPPWIGDMMNNMWGGQGNPWAGNSGTGVVGPNNPNSGNASSPSNNSALFPDWIQDVIAQNGFPFGNGSGNGKTGGNLGFFGPQQGFNPFAMFQSQTSSQTNQAVHSSGQRPSRHPSQKRSQPQSNNYPRRFDSGRR